MGVYFKPITWENYPNQWYPIGKIEVVPAEPRKCKCCGAPLTYEKDFIRCEYCGTFYKWGDE